MSYIQANNLNIIEEEIIKFQSMYLNQNIKTHIVVQTLNGYELNLQEADASIKELHAFISNIVTTNSDDVMISKDDLVYLITAAKISFSDKQSLNLQHIENIEETPVQQNVEIKFKEILLNLIKV